MTKKEIGIGFAVGIIANVIGILLYILLFSDLSIAATIKASQETDHLGSLIALGAILNLGAFFGFLKLKRDARARGVLMATILSAFIILILKFF
ncbi:hypothetical protein [Robertkochia aurantiaca]|uniref:hypothetical protein n=1 Tax=Robertkochia aurantiaca TaxID=2873700 RepID=UPI001CC9E17C|nr:hypothetical protein [Robertkochia sp. 3YJGBD-33]